MTLHASAESSSSDWTIRRVVAWATGDFQARGIDNARLDAEILLAHALGVDRIRLILDADRRLADRELGIYRELIKRRRAGEPIAYVVGQREFYGRTFRVDRRVLIPRPDTEALIEVALERTRARDLCGRALDLCTGSGCVAVSFARARPTWQTTAIDVSLAALALARENALRLGAIWGLRLLSGDLFEPLGRHERFDLVMANPPYIQSAEIERLDPGVRDYEPRLALDGGANGLAVMHRIVSEAPARLSPGGVLAVEVCAGQADEVARLFETAGLSAIERRRDYGGHERVVSGRT